MEIFESHAQELDLWKKPRKVLDESNNKIYSGTSSYNSRLYNLKYLKSLSSQAPQVVIKIKSHAAGKAQIRNVLDYVSREKFSDKDTLEMEDDQGRQYKDREEREKLLKEWSRDFVSKEQYDRQSWKTDEIHKMEAEKEKLEYFSQSRALSKDEAKILKQLDDCIKNKYKISANGQMVDLAVKGVRDTTHIIMSVGGQPNEKDALEATRNFLQENIKAAGYQYTFVMHNDTNNLHCHLVVNNRNVLDKDKKLFFDKADLFSLRQQYAEHLKNMGVTREATLRRDREAVMELISKRQENLKEQNSGINKKL
jgi:Relaxase/Mobilisation nuclease domain.